MIDKIINSKFQNLQQKNLSTKFLELKKNLAELYQNLIKNKSKNSENL